MEEYKGEEEKKEYEGEEGVEDHELDKEEIEEV